MNTQAERFDTTLAGRLPGLDLSRVPLHLPDSADRHTHVQTRAAHLRLLGCSDEHIEVFVAESMARPSEAAPQVPYADTTPAGMYTVDQVEPVVFTDTPAHEPPLPWYDRPGWA